MIFVKKLSQYLLANELESDSSKGLMDDLEMMAIIIFYQHSGFNKTHEEFKNIKWLLFKRPQNYTQE